MITEYGVFHMCSPHQVQEDRYRVLNHKVPVVTSKLGHTYMVADGVGGADLGMQTVQKLADNLVSCYLEPEKYSKATSSLLEILNETNAECQ